MPQGKELFAEGENPSTLWYLRRGRVVFGCVARDGKLGSCGVRGAGALLGLEALLGVPMPHGVRALTDLVLCSIDLPTFRRWLGLDTHPSPASTILSLTLRESSLRAADRQALEGTSLQRVSRFLLINLQASSPDEPLDLQQQVVARVLGMRPETLSRALATLRKGRALARGRSLRVTDPQALRRFAGL